MDGVVGEGDYVSAVDGDAASADVCVEIGWGRRVIVNAGRGSIPEWAEEVSRLFS